MSDTEALFTILRQSADADAAAAIDHLVRDAPDRALNRINVLDFAAARGLNEQRALAAFLHAARLGLFDLSWNVLFLSCGGGLAFHTSLNFSHRGPNNSAFCYSRVLTTF